MSKYIDIFVAFFNNWTGHRKKIPKIKNYAINVGYLVNFTPDQLILKVLFLKLNRSTFPNSESLAEPDLAEFRPLNTCFHNVFLTWLLGKGCVLVFNPKFILFVLLDFFFSVRLGTFWMEEKLHYLEQVKREKRVPESASL